MGRQPKINWIDAFQSYVAGQSHRQIADAHGVTIGAVKQRSRLDDWTAKRRQIQDSQLVAPAEQSLEAIKQGAVTRWVKTVLGHLQRLTTMASCVELTPKRSDLAKDVQIMEGIVRSGRLMFELDKDSGSQAPRLGVVVHGNASITVGPAQQSRRMIPDQSNDTSGASDQTTVDVQGVSDTDQPLRH